MERSGAFGAVAAVLGLAAALAARAAPRDLPGSDEPGTVLIETADGEAVLVRRPSPAFALTEDDALHPAVDPACANVVWSSRLALPQTGHYRFTVECEGGEALVRIVPGLETGLKGGETSAWIPLEEGSVNLFAAFGREHAGAARFRILWELAPTETAGFPREPIPSRAFMSPAEVALDVERDDPRDRELLERKGCTACHAPTRAELAAVGVRSAPALDGIGSRASPPWLMRWLRAPAELRAHADMPALFGEGEEDDLTALVQFLAGRRGAETADAVVTGETQVLADGRRLYHTVGCVACHGALASPADVFGDEFLSAEVPAVDVPAPFGDLEGKWRAPELARFLREPSAVLPDGRMPSLELTGAEADLIATYLVQTWGGSFQPWHIELGLSQRGRAVFVERGCHACHDVEGIEAPVAAPPLDRLDLARGCLDPDDVDTPRYDLADGERDRLRRAIASVRRATGHPAPLDRAARTLERLSCLACHAQDGAGGPPEALRVFFTSSDDRVDLGDEGRFPPDLSGVGWKLNTAWLRDVLVEDGRARPYLTTRMPSYGAAHVGGLAEDLARTDGVVPYTDVTAPEATDELVTTGRDLMSRRALGCMACHVYGDYPATGSPGPAITSFAERLRYEWFRPFMMNPQRYLPGSRMPDFGTANVSTLRRVYDGDMLRQTDAMWAYFELGKLMMAPEA